MGGLQGKTAVVTGAAQGMGLEIAREFARRGASLILTDINEEKLQTALDSVHSLTGLAIKYVCDVQYKNQWDRMIENVKDQFESVDILVNNAAVYKVTPFEQISEKEWDFVFAVNVKGALFGCQAVAPLMRHRKWGRIINIASQAGKTGGLLIGAHYSASKAALICMTKSFAAALAADGITVNAIAPGIINTEFLDGVPGVQSFFPRIPLGNRPGEAIDVAHAVCFLASEESRYITGEILDVNGGLLMD